MNHKILQTLIGYIVLSICVPAFGHLIELWPYERLVAESDLVAIIEPLKNEVVKDTFPDPPGPSLSANDVDAVNTLFKIHALLKSTDAVHPTLKELTLLHFVYSTNSAYPYPAGLSHFIEFPIAPPLQFKGIRWEKSKTEEVSEPYR